MNANSASFFFERYTLHKNKNLEITLHNGKILHGKIIGFYRSSSNEDEIEKWHFITSHDNMLNPMELIGVNTGIIIKHKDIDSIKFMEDNSIMNFKK